MGFYIYHKIVIYTPDWVKSNCNIVAYVLNATTQEIIQVEEIHLTN